MGETECKSSRLDYTRFLEGNVWKDIKTELENMATDVGNNLIVERNHDEIFRFQGRGEAIKDLIVHIESGIPEGLGMVEEVDDV